MDSSLARYRQALAAEGAGVIFGRYAILTRGHGASVRVGDAIEIVD